MTPIDVAGLTLLHFVWQGTVCGALAILALHLLRRRSPQARYVAACLALALMLAAPVVTAAILARPDPSSMFTAVPHAARTSAGVTPAAVPPARTGYGTTAAAPTTMPGAGSRPQLGAIVALWVSGVALLLVRFGLGWRTLRRLRRSAMLSLPSRWSSATERIASILDIRRAIRVVDSIDVNTPTVIGWLKPVILLPVAGLANLTPAQVDAIIAHELAHVQRHDCLVNLIQVVAETLLFYHPAVWWVSARIRREREHCCDDAAASLCGDVVAYAEALVELERWRVERHSFALAATGGPLLGRIRRLLRAPADDAPRSGAVITIAGVAIALVCLWGAAQYLRAAQFDQSSLTRIEPDDATAWQIVFTHDDSQMRFIGFRGRDLARFAYQVPSARVVGGPHWMDEEILRLVVSLDQAPRADEMPDLVRRVLEDRLQLRTHVERRNFPVLALALARPDGSLGPNLHDSTTDCFDMEEWIAAGQPPRVLPPAARRQPVCGEKAWDTPFGRSAYVAITMPQFAEALRHEQTWPTTPAQRGREIVDRTGLPGRYDIDLESFVPAAVLMARYPMLTSILEPAGFSSLPHALEEQLGLTLKEAEAPFDVIVIDGAERP